MFKSIMEKFWQFAFQHPYEKYALIRDSKKVYFGSLQLLYFDLFPWTEQNNNSRTSISGTLPQTSIIGLSIAKGESMQ